MDEQEYQKKNLERIFLNASHPPVFRLNPKYCRDVFADAIPFISYGDVMDRNYIIRAAESLDEDVLDYNAPECPVIYRYKNIDELVEDGWELD